MKTFIQLLLILLFVAVWLFPVIIGFWTGNFWYISLYIVWWFPAFILSYIIVGILNSIE